MFICTNKGSILLRGIPSTTFNVVNVNRLIDSIKLAPDVDGNPIDAVLVTSDDISSRVLVNKFVEALQGKHPEVVVLYVNKRGKARGEEMFTNVDYNLMKPTTEVLRSTITEIISRSNKKAVSSMEENNEEEPDVPDFAAGKADSSGYKPGESKQASTERLDIPEPKTSTAETREENLEPEGRPIDENKLTDDLAHEVDVALSEQAIPKIEPPSPEDVNKRFAKAVSTAELTSVLDDLSLENIIKDVMENNADYERLEERISTLAHNIDRIMTSGDDTPTEEKLRRVHALTYERSKFLGPKATVIEQYVEKIIMKVTGVCISDVTSRINEINKIIVDARPTANTLSSSDIIQLKENRTNALIELDMFLEELAAIETSLRKLGTDAITLFVNETNDICGNLYVNDSIRRQCSPIISKESLDAIKAMYEKLSELPDEFQTLANLIRSTKSLIHKVLDCDSRLIEELERAVERLSLSQIAKSSIAKDIVGRTSRVFIGAKGSGRTIIPYLFAKMHSRENSNVLYLNLCGTEALSRYGISYTSLGEFILNPIREEVSVVCGEIDAANPIEEISGALLKANPFYQAIYIVVPEDNEEAIEVLTDNALAAYLICNPAQGNFVKQANLLRRLEPKVCLKSVVFNNFDKVTSVGVEMLGIAPDAQVTCFAIKHIDALVEASMDGEDPSIFTNVHTIFQTLRKYV